MQYGLYRRKFKGFLTIACIFALLSLGGCGIPGPRMQYPLESAPVADLQHIPQRATHFVLDSTEWLLEPRRQDELAREYRQRALAVWHGQTDSYDAAYAFWPEASVQRNPGYGPNYRPHSTAWVTGVLHNADRATYPNANWPAIVVERVDLRALPTHQPRFSRPDGFPFDLLQNSSLWPGTPVQVLHRSRDGRWLFVAAAHVGGWLPASRVIPAGAEFRQALAKRPWAAVVRDRMPLRSSQGATLGRTGMLLPVLDSTEQHWRIGLPVQGPDGMARWEGASIARNAGDIQSFPLPMQAGQIARVADELRGEPYGWGGMYGHRDCSASLRDIFATFGIWLPRNSSKQIQAGTRIDLENMTNTHKRRTLRERGQPWRTLVGMNGHIMLYVGTHQGQPVVFHNLWGLGTRRILDERNGRLVIGQAVFTSLSPGRERADVQRSGSLLVDRVHSLTLLD